MNYEMAGLGAKIGNTIDLIRTKVDLISEEELSAFQDFINQLDTTMPVTDPSLYIRRGRDDLDKARAGLILIRQIKRDLEACGDSV